MPRSVHYSRLVVVRNCNDPPVDAEARRHSPQTNAGLYTAGKHYSKRLAQLRVKGKKKARPRDVAAKCGVSPDEVGHALTVAKSVDLIAANCGVQAKKLFLSDHPRLPANVVVQIGRTHADRQQFALAQVKAGRNPFGKPPEGVEPPFDTHGYTEVLSRLARSAGLLDHVTDGLLATPPTDWPDANCLRDVRDHLHQIRVFCRRIAALMERCGGSLKEERGGQPWRARETKQFLTKSTRWKVASVLKITEKNDRDLPRVMRETPPSMVEAANVLGGIRKLRRSSERLLAVLAAKGHDYSVGPADVPGTYVVFFRLTKAAKNLKIGDLGTFDFPAGFYAYLGSAFGAGGVKKRTSRHLTRRSKEKWNIDHLKPRCTPVAAWWTHDRRKVEFDWAAILGSLTGASFPAKGFGSADNPRAKAHLVHFAEMPSFEEFQGLVLSKLPGHAVVRQGAIENWIGAGWAI